MESVHDISEGFLTYDDGKDIDTHQCSIDIIELYSNHIALHLNASKERLLDDYKKKYKLEDMPIARVTRPQAAATSDAPTPAQSATSETFGERAWRLFNKRDAADVSTGDTTMAVVVRPAEREPPPQHDTFIDTALYIKLKTTLKVIFVSGWEELMQQYQFNELDERFSKLEKGQNVTKSAEVTAVELDREISMDAELIGKFITQQVADAMVKKIKQY